MEDKELENENEIEIEIDTPANFIKRISKLPLDDENSSDDNISNEDRQDLIKLAESLLNEKAFGLMETQTLTSSIIEYLLLKGVILRPLEPEQQEKGEEKYFEVLNQLNNVVNDRKNTIKRNADEKEKMIQKRNEISVNLQSLKEGKAVNDV